VTLAASAVFSMLSPGHRTVTVATSLSVPVPLVVVIVALFLTVPQSCGAVDESMWITGSEPGPSTWVKLESSTWLATEPGIEQPVWGGSSCQFRSPPATPSAPAGRTSWTWTPVAGTDPSLVTVRSKPIVEPALTGPGGFADLATSIWAATIVADSWASVQVPSTLSLSESPG